MGDCSFGYVGTPLFPTYGTTKPRGGLAVKKSFTRSTGTQSGFINGVYFATNLSSVLLESPVETTTCEWIAIGDNIPESPMSSRGDSGGSMRGFETKPPPVDDPEPKTNRLLLFREWVRHKPSGNDKPTPARRGMSVPQMRLMIL